MGSEVPVCLIKHKYLPYPYFDSRNREKQPKIISEVNLCRYTQVDLEERPPSPCAPAKAISSDSEVREREEKSKGIFPPINPSWWRIKKRKRDGDEEQGSSGSDSSFVESDGESTEDGQTKLKGDFPAKRIPSVSPEKPVSDDPLFKIKFGESHVVQVHKSWQ